MDRKYIVVGDAPACGGSVLSFTCRPSDTINGHQKALIGGRVFCAACDSIGFIAKAGGPDRAFAMRNWHWKAMSSSAGARFRRYWYPLSRTLPVAMTAAGSKADSMHRKCREAGIARIRRL